MEWSILFIIVCALFRRVKNLAVEDSGRLFGKVDTAAPGKAAPVMRTSRFHPCFKRLFIRESVLHKQRWVRKIKL